MGHSHNYAIHTGDASSELISNYYHLYSEGTQSDVLFHNQDEFIDGMNIVATAFISSEVKILAFCIMDNHFHFILVGEQKDVLNFARKINQVYGIKRKNWKTNDTLKETMKWEAALIHNERYLLNCITYVMNNPVKAGYDKWVLDYPWSSNDLYFREHHILEEKKRIYKRTEECTTRDLRGRIRSYKNIPKDWLFTSEKYIWPGNYVDWELVEQHFGNLKRMLYFLNSKKEAEETGLSLVRSRIAISDQEIRRIVIETAENMFRVVEINLLCLDERIQLAQRVIQKTGCKREQLYRILHLTEK